MKNSKNPDLSRWRDPLLSLSYVQSPLQLGGIKGLLVKRKFRNIFLLMKLTWDKMKREGKREDPNTFLLRKLRIPCNNLSSTPAMPQAAHQRQEAHSGVRPWQCMVFLLHCGVLNSGHINCHCNNVNKNRGKKFSILFPPLLKDIQFKCELSELSSVYVFLWH